MRENELNCLNQVKESFANHSNLTKEFDNADYSVMRGILVSASQNPNHSVFPDFFFDGGVIEHFEVTCTGESRKGSDYKIVEKDKQQKVKEASDKQKETYLKQEYNPGTIETHLIEARYEFFTHDDFIKSFKRNCLKHIDSLSKSEYKNQTVVFLIELQDSKLCVYENGSFKRFYLLHEDIKVLSFIKECLTNVNYVIFKTMDTYEILDLSKIDDLILNSKDDLDIRSGRHRDGLVNVYWDI